MNLEEEIQRIEQEIADSEAALLNSPAPEVLKAWIEINQQVLAEKQRELAGG